ncbi:MAG: hypothetical protein EB127_12105, partial [Alphaproteobacteria bacterium]|nr:hypothetical protein [Alphaproteobacteria bacterium]
GLSAFVRDDGNGILNIVSGLNGSVITNIGTIDYITGTLNLINFILDAYSGTNLTFYGYPLNKDISVNNNVILNIISSDLSITAEAIRG